MLASRFHSKSLPDRSLPNCAKLILCTDRQQHGPGPCVLNDTTTNTTDQEQILLSTFLKSIFPLNRHESHEFSHNGTDETLWFAAKIGLLQPLSVYHQYHYIPPNTALWYYLLCAPDRSKIRKKVQFFEKAGPTDPDNYCSVFFSVCLMRFCEDTICTNRSLALAGPHDETSTSNWRGNIEHLKWSLFCSLLGRKTSILFFTGFKWPHIFRFFQWHLDAAVLRYCTIPYAGPFCKTPMIDCFFSREWYTNFLAIKSPTYRDGCNHDCDCFPLIIHKLPSLFLCDSFLHYFHWWDSFLLPL